MTRPNPTNNQQRTIGETLPDLLALAKYPNVAVKATGAPSYSSDSYPYTDIHDHIHQEYDAFGPNRTFWGTAITRMPCPCSQCISLFTEELPWLPESDKELVISRRPERGNRAQWGSKIASKAQARTGTAPGALAQFTAIRIMRPRSRCRSSQLEAMVTERR